MKTIFARNAISPACLLATMVLAGCSMVGKENAASTGMKTDLLPGQRISIVVRGASPAVRLTSDGPGSVCLVREGTPPVESSLGVRGVAEVVVEGGGSLAVINRSAAPVSVDVLVFGAETADIQGPAVSKSARSPQGNW